MSLSYALLLFRGLRTTFIDKECEESADSDSVVDSVLLEFQNPRYVCTFESATESADESAETSHSFIDINSFALQSQSFKVTSGILKERPPAHLTQYVARLSKKSLRF